MLLASLNASPHLRCFGTLAKSTTCLAWAAPEMTNFWLVFPLSQVTQSLDYAAFEPSLLLQHAGPSNGTLYERVMEHAESMLATPMPMPANPPLLSREISLLVLGSGILLLLVVTCLVPALRRATVPQKQKPSDDAAKPASRDATTTQHETRSTAAALTAGSTVRTASGSTGSLSARSLDSQHEIRR